MSGKLQAAYQTVPQVILQSTLFIQINSAEHEVT